jgi:hypothetical protein
MEYGSYKFAAVLYYFTARLKVVFMKIYLKNKDKREENTWLHEEE